MTGWDGYMGVAGSLIHIAKIQGVCSDTWE